MKISLRQFRTDDLLIYENWRSEINAQDYMSNFYPHALNGEIITNSKQFVWYVISVDGTEVGTIWLEKEKVQDSLVTLGIIIGHPDKLGIGIGQQVIPLAIEFAHATLRFKGVRLFVRLTNYRAIACYKACGFRILGEGTKINQKGEEIRFLEMYLQTSHSNL